MFKKINKLSQPRIFALGFFFIIAIGTLLLSLPIAVKPGEKITFLNSLFTATSATCVTGLVVVDTVTHWSIFGQLVILLMIQIGGLGFMTIGVIFSLFLRKKIGLRTRGMLQESINAERLGGIIRLTKKMIGGTIIIEGLGAIILAIRFIPELGVLRGIYYGIFHSISAFCNAGFDLFGYQAPYNSLVNYVTDPTINIVIMLLIIIGGLGFVVWDDITHNGLKVKKYKLHTKLVLVTTTFLIVVGALLYYIFEKDNLYANASAKETFWGTLFSSVTARTAGFNTTDIASMTESSKLLTIVLMFIGGSPGSTAGGVKTITVAVLIIYVWNNLRNTRGCNAFSRRIDDTAIKKASIVAVISLVMAITASLAISHLQDASLSDIMLEVFSAIGTVGLSSGITRDMTTISRIILIALMYCGRIGSMSFALSFTDRKKVAPVQLPTEKIMIG